MADSDDEVGETVPLCSAECRRLPSRLEACVRNADAAVGIFDGVCPRCATAAFESITDIVNGRACDRFSAAQCSQFTERVVNYSGFVDACLRAMGDSTPHPDVSCCDGLDFEHQLKRVLQSRECRRRNRAAHRRARRGQIPDCPELNLLTSHSIASLGSKPKVFWYAIRFEAMCEDALRAAIHHIFAVMRRHGKGSVPAQTREAVAFHFDRLSRMEESPPDASRSWTGRIGAVCRRLSLVSNLPWRRAR